VSVRDALREMQERMGVVYEVTKLLREGVEWISRMLFGNKKANG
jgi:hypothetical protein